MKEDAPYQYERAGIDISAWSRGEYKPPRDDGRGADYIVRFARVNSATGIKHDLHVDVAADDPEDAIAQALIRLENRENLRPRDPVFDAIVEVHEVSHTTIFNSTFVEKQPIEPFAFDIGDDVEVQVSGQLFDPSETGEVVDRMVKEHSERNVYQILGNDNVNEWFFEDQLRGDLE